MTATDARRTERAAVAAEQVATLYLNHDPGEAAAFVALMSAGARPDTTARPRHVKRWPPTT